MKSRSTISRITSRGVKWSPAVSFDASANFRISSSKTTPIWLFETTLGWRSLLDRKMVEVLRSAGCPRLVYVDHVARGGDRLLDAVREVGAEGVVAKRAAG